MRPHVYPHPRAHGHLPARRRSPVGLPSGGMTLVEVMVAVVVLTISVYLMSTTITTSAMHMQIKEERGLAVDAARNQLEVLRGTSFPEIFASFNDSPADDPDGPSTAPGRNFAVEGLDPWEDDADGCAGEVLLPLSGGGLYENAELPEFGLPRDLNGDFQIDGRDHAEDYIVMPVRVRVAWRGRGGKRQFEMQTMLARLERM